MQHSPVPRRLIRTSHWGGVIDYSGATPARHVFLEAKTIVAKASFGGSLTISSPQGLSDEERERWENKQAEAEYQAKLEAQLARLEPAYRDETAAKVLELMKTENPSGADVFKIYELMAGPKRKHQAFNKQFGIEEREFKRFTDAVYNPLVTEDWARHGYQDRPKTSNPMSTDLLRAGWNIFVGRRPHEHGVRRCSDKPTRQPSFPRRPGNRRRGNRMRVGCGAVAAALTMRPSIKRWENMVRQRGLGVTWCSMRRSVQLDEN